MPASASSPPSADLNLLFGILALQMDFVSRDALIKAMNAWVLHKSSSLGEILLDQGALRIDTYALLQALVQKHLEMHGGDAQKSLASVSSIGSARQQLEQIADADVQHSLALVATPATEDDPFATQPPTVGESTSSGQRFRILRPHAEGGLGKVFVAHDQELRRSVALKEIKDRFADDPDKRLRFLLEAEITGGLEHPGIVPVYGLGQYADGRPFYAMRFIKGDSLQDAIQRFHQADTLGRDEGERTLALRKLLGRFLDVCNAIAYAHSRGVLHRDLKPGNIMLGKYGETLVVDWGLAKPLGRVEVATETMEGPLQPSSASGSTPTQMGSALGTPAYMSPEQAAGRLDQLGPASDVYSLGATLYCLLTGQPPFEGTYLGEMLRRVQQGEFRPPRSVKGTVPPALEAVCLKAMALKPEDRYASPRALAEDLEHWLADEPVSAWREPWTTTVRRWLGRHRTLLTASAAACVVAVTALSLTTVLLMAANRETEIQRDAAREETREKEEARRKEAEALDRVKRALFRSDTLVYIGNIKRAQREWENTSIGPARKALAECNEGFRNWEYAYLSRLCEGSERTLKGHNCTILGVAISPDGTKLASVGGSLFQSINPDAGEVKVWNAETSRELVTLDVRPDTVFSSVAFHPDGKRLAVGGGKRSGSGEVKVWDVSNGRTIHTLEGHKGLILGVSFSPDGKHLATTALDQTAKIWSADSGKEERTLTGHNGPVFGVAFSPDSEHIATGGMDLKIKVWNTRTGSEEHTFTGHKQAIYRLNYSPDGKWLVSTGFDPRGSGVPGEVKVWDCKAGTVRHSLSGHADGVHCAAFSPDSSVIATASYDETVRLWDTLSGRPRLLLKGHAAPVNSLTFSPDGRRLISGSDDKTVKVWNPATDPKARFLQGHQGWVTSLAFNSDGQRLLSGSQDKSVKLWDMHTGKDILTIKGHSAPVRSVAFCPDGKRVASGDERGMVKLWDSGTGREVLSFKANAGWVQSLAFSPDEKLLISAGHERQLRVWELQSGREAFSLEGHTEIVDSVAFSPDGRLIASGGYDRVIRVWDVSTKQARYSLEGHRYPIHVVAFSPDGRWLASGAGTLKAPGELKLWDIKSGQEVYSLQGHTSHVLGVSFSPDGKRLASVSQYVKMNGIFGEIKLWDLATGLETLTLSGLGMPEVAISFSPDGQRLATAGWMRRITIWDASSQ